MVPEQIMAPGALVLPEPRAGHRLDSAPCRDSAPRPEPSPPGERSLAGPRPQSSPSGSNSLSRGGASNPPPNRLGSYGSAR